MSSISHASLVVEKSARPHRVTIIFYANFSFVQWFANMEETDKEMFKGSETYEEKIEKVMDNIYHVIITYKKASESKLPEIYGKAFARFMSKDVYKDMYHCIEDIQISE